MYKENNEHLADKLVRIKGFQCHCEGLTPAEDQNYAALEMRTRLGAVTSSTYSGACVC